MSGARATRLLLAAALAWFAVPAAPRAEPVDRGTIEVVLRTALAVLADRHLAARPVNELALWSLGGLTALDATLAVVPRQAVLTLAAGDRTVATIPAPARDDVAGWARTVADLADTAAAVSARVRRAGTQGVLRSLFAELFARLDPYSRYATPREAALARDRRGGRGGPGFRLAPPATIRNVLPDSPAADAGIVAGERLTAVDGRSVFGLDLRRIGQLLAGPEGTPVTLSLRDTLGRGRVVTVDRVPMPPQTVFPLPGPWPAFRVAVFAQDTDARLAEAIAAALARPRAARGVILDLRGNPGGLLRQAVAAGDVFLGSGTLAVTSGRHPEANRAFEAGGTDATGGAPVVVLIDGQSASAAEILAAGLADLRRAVLVGSATLGKGLIQAVVELPDGGELLVSWSRVLAPRGWPIQDLGVLPSVCTSTGAEGQAALLAALRRGTAPPLVDLRRHQAAQAPLAPSEAAEIRSACPAASGRPIDLEVARLLLANPAAYAAALLPGDGGVERSTR